MKRLFLLTAVAVMMTFPAYSQFEIVDNRPVFSLDGDAVITAPDEGLWAIATSWQNDWMDGWHYANPTKCEQSGEWTILSGVIALEQGEMLVRDSYRKVREDLVQCVRRYEWRGKETLPTATLSVRLRMKGREMIPNAGIE